MILGMPTDGIERKEQLWERMSLPLAPSMLTELRALAKAQGKKQTAIVREYIDEGLHKDKVTHIKLSQVIHRLSVLEEIVLRDKPARKKRDALPAKRP